MAGTLAATITEFIAVEYRDADYTGSGTLTTTNMLPRYTTTATYTATGALAGTVTARYARSAALAAAGALATTSTQKYAPTATLAATGALAATVITVAPVTFNAVGSRKLGDTSGHSSPYTFTWTHTASGTDRCVLVALAVSRSGAAATSTITRSATYGGIAMTELGAGALANISSQAHEMVWGLMNPPTGLQTISITIDAGINNVGAAGNSVSYNGVGSVGEVSTTWGTATGTAMQDDVVAAGDRSKIFQAFAAYNSGTSIGSYNQTTRLNSADTAWSYALLIGDASGSAGTVSFTATRDTGVDWRSYAVVLNPV